MFLLSIFLYYYHRNSYFDFIININIICLLCVFCDCIQQQIVLAKRDPIVPASIVERYLSAKQKQGFTCFEVIEFDGTHGEILLHKQWLTLLVNKIQHHISAD